MRNRTLITWCLVSVCALVPSVLTRAESGQAPARRSASGLVNGHAWVASSMDQKRAYLLGVSDLMRVASAYRERHGGSEPQQQEMIGILDRSLGQVHLNEVVARVNAFYGRSGTDLNTPVLVVIWREFVKPNLSQSK